MNDPGRGYIGAMITGDTDADLKALIGAAEDRREAGQRKKAASRARGRKAKARTRGQIAAASRKRNRR